MANKIASSASFVFGRTEAARPNGKKLNEVLLVLNESEQILFYAHQAEDHLKTGAEQVREGGGQYLCIRWRETRLAFLNATQ